MKHWILAPAFVRSGVPTNLAVAWAEQIAAPGMVNPTAFNPLYYGIPWMISGPVSGAPYYLD